MLAERLVAAAICAWVSRRTGGCCRTSMEVHTALSPWIKYEKEKLHTHKCRGFKTHTVNEPGIQMNCLESSVADP